MVLENSLVSRILFKCYQDRNVALIAVADKEPLQIVAYVHDSEQAMHTISGVSEFETRSIENGKLMCFYNTMECIVSIKSVDCIIEIPAMKYDYVFDKDALLAEVIKCGTVDPNLSADVNFKEQFPVPSHLKDIFKLTSDNCSDNVVHGSIVCTCGCKQFSLSVLMEDNSIDESYLFAQCVGCKKEFVVFDSNIHGWNGFVCKLHIERDENNKHTLFCCRKCGANVFVVYLKISSEGKQDFVENLKEEIQDGVFSEDDWVNAFDWITIDLACSICNQRFLSFIDCETA